MNEIDTSGKALSVSAGEIETNYHDAGARETWSSCCTVRAPACRPGPIGKGSYPRCRSVPGDRARHGRIRLFRAQARPPLRHQAVVEASDRLPRCHGPCAGFLLGNSFGGSLALAAAARFPDRFERLVLMGTPCDKFMMTPGLRAGWDYVPVGR